jgi:PKHD-type hydroxylase
MLITIDSFLTPGELATARSLLAQSSWASGAITAGPQAALAKHNEQLPDEAPHLPALRALVLGALHRSPTFFAAALPLKVLPPFFNRYAGQANTYGWHTDCAMRMVPGGSGGAGYVRSDVSATLFLSDPQDYDGGELSIEDTFGTHSVKLPAGSLVLYPSSSIHAVTPVTRGERLACFMFMQSMVRDAGQRRLLYDMDMALLQLREQVGELDAVVRLTGTYHNLLRQWAES